MNHNIAKKWVAALRSGKYKQGHGKLRRDNEFCCLGVLCDLAVREKVIKRPVREDVEEDGSFSYGPEHDVHYLPDEVVKWAGLRFTDGTYSGGAFGEGPRKSLSDDNDGGNTLLEIADKIEQKWEVL